MKWWYRPGCRSRISFSLKYAPSASSLHVENSFHYGGSTVRRTVNLPSASALSSLGGMAPPLCALAAAIALYKLLCWI